jgi:hypothetical protein
MLELNVTDAPVHAGLADAEMVIDTGELEITVMLIPGEVAGLPDTHGAFDVMVHVMASLFTGA